jgi:hypothetical protein
MIEHPKPKARRALTLVAKSLQGLANMSSFGTKEAWMEPMNVFLNSHRQEFKTYLDNICSISSTTSPAPHIPPSYSTPLAILQRLPPTSREGFPSLPYLIDHARNFAALVDLWLTNTRTTAVNIQSTDGDLLRFHQICVALNERTSDCLNRAERAERPSSSLSVKWEELVEQLQGSASFEMGRGAATKNRGTGTLKEERESVPNSPGTGEDSSATNTPVTMRPARSARTRHQHASSISASATSLNSINSNMLQYPPKIPRPSGTVGFAPSINDSSQPASATASASASAAEETPPGSSDGLHMAPPPSYPQTHTHPSTSSSSVTYVNSTNVSSMASLSRSGVFSHPPRSAGGQSVDDSDRGSIQEDEGATALPAFYKDASTKERKDRGFRGVLPFQRKRKDKDKDKGKHRDRSTDRSDSAGRGNGSTLGEYASYGSLRGRAGADGADFGNQ